MKTGTAVEYAVRRTREHIERFTGLYMAAKSDNISEKWLSEIEERDRIFPEIDYRVYSSPERSLSKG